MGNEFKLITPGEISDNTFKLIGKDWLLITAGTKNNFNTMTASWGGFGVLWRKNVAFIVVRPTRYTYEFLESADSFTLSFFEEKYRDVLNLCGTKSGRDLDKAAAAGITPVEDTPGLVYFDEARLVLECKKLYFHDFDPRNFLEEGINELYNDDYHRLYIGEITKSYIKE